MAENSKIEWTDHTFNPWTGCTKVSPACDHCYAEGWAKRSGHVQWGPHGDRRLTSAANWRKPLKWNEEARRLGIRYRVFCASLADVFDNHHSIMQDWRAQLWALIRATPNLDWQLLTKRPQNIAKMLPSDWGDGWPNVWIGTTVENQVEADRRIPIFLNVPARVRFLSCEPLLGPLELRQIAHGKRMFYPLQELTWKQLWKRYWPNKGSGISYSDARASYDSDGGVWPPDNTRPRGIDWVICGGESGRESRPMNINWARHLRDQCKKAGVPFFMKQWGDWSPTSDHEANRVPWGGWVAFAGHGQDPDVANLFASKGAAPVIRIGKAKAGRMLDGCEHREFPKIRHD